MSKEKTVSATGRKSPSTFCAKEFKVVALRECPMDNPICDTPEFAWNYWRAHIETHPYFMPQVESCFVILLNTRRRVIGHQLVSMGTLDTILIHPREIFRAAIIASASAIIMMHNHPSGDPTPSEADVKVTRDLIQAGQLLKIEVLDHVIAGKPCRWETSSVWHLARTKRDKAMIEAMPTIRGYSSLKEMGFFVQ